MTRDPVCGKEVDPLRARAVGIWGGRTYYFCSPEHKGEFARNPGAYGEQGAREPTQRAGAAPVAVRAEEPVSAPRVPAPARGGPSQPGPPVAPAPSSPRAVTEPADPLPPAPLRTSFKVAIAAAVVLAAIVLLLLLARR